MPGTFDSVEPVMDVVVFPAARGRRGVLSYGIAVDGVRLPVGYRVEADALRIADRLVSLLADGYEERWRMILAAA